MPICSLSLTTSTSSLAVWPTPVLTQRCSLTGAGGSEEAGNISSYSFELGDLFPFTEYQFNLSEVYGDTDSDPVQASNTTDDDGKRERGG